MTSRSTAPYRLGELAKLSSELRLESQRVGENRLDIRLAANCVLGFYNLVDDDDTLIGFEGTPWHAHGVVQFMTGKNTFLDCDELDILVGLGSGELVVMSQYLGGDLKDRWLAHKGEPLDLRYIQPGEELRVLRIQDAVEAILEDDT